jgi:hypothetical protein
MEPQTALVNVTLADAILRFLYSRKPPKRAALSVDCPCGWPFSDQSAPCKASWDVSKDRPRLDDHFAQNSSRAELPLVAAVPPPTSI